MRIVRWSLPILALAAAPALADGSRPAPHEVAAFFEVEYSTPNDWSCKTDEECLICRNTSSGPSNIVVTHVPNANEETHAIPRGSEVRSCGNVIQIPHGGE